jgi:hypothetical protein
MPSRFEINCEIQTLQKIGMPDDIIKLIMSEKYPDQFNKDEIISEMQTENDFIYGEMMKKGFQPFHEILSANIIQDGQPETQEEAESQEEAQDANSEAKPEASQCSDS